MDPSTVVSATLRCLLALEQALPIQDDGHRHRLLTIFARYRADQKSPVRGQVIWCEANGINFE
jgi:hypothetical protein